jgi:hypothetical protein
MVLSMTDHNSAGKTGLADRFAPPDRDESLPMLECHRLQRPTLTLPNGDQRLA